MSVSTVVTIEKIIPGGAGLARMSDGLVVMVPGVLAFEKVAVRIFQKKKGYAHAHLVEVLEPSPLRSEPPCPYYGECGGCDLQHVSYHGQLQVKQQILREQLIRNAGAGGTWQKVLLEMQPAQEPFFYRQRLRLQVDARGRMGFFKSKTKDVVPISRCLLASPTINVVLEKLYVNTAAQNLLKHSGAIELMCDLLEDKVVSVFHFLRKPRATDIHNSRGCAASISEMKSLFLQTKSKGVFGPFADEAGEAHKPVAPSFLRYSVPLKDGKTVRMLFETGGFCQVNAKQNERLIHAMLEWADISSEMAVLDLYCGLGNFSIPAALYCKNLHGVDLQRSAIRSAMKNAENNSVDNCFFEKKSAFDAAKNLAKIGAQFDLVILDPPRQGCKDIIPFVEKIAACQIIYISCDPATLARDLGFLLRSGFTLKKMQGVDMFPQTHHVETIVLLKKVSCT